MSAQLSTPKYEPPANGLRTFFVMWLTQAFSAFGSQLTFFAVTIWLSTSLYAREGQKPDLAFAGFQLFNLHLLKVEDKEYLDNIAEWDSPETGMLAGGTAAADLNAAA